MTLKEKDFIEDQLHIIQNKINEDALNRYATLLSVADISEEVKAVLKRAVDMREKELNPIDYLVVGAKFD